MVITASLLAKYVYHITSYCWSKKCARRKLFLASDDSW